MVVEDVAHPFYSTLLAGVGSVAAELGYDILVQQTSAVKWENDRLVEIAVTRAVDGMLVATELSPWSDSADALSRIPVVSCDQAIEVSEFPRVYIDHFQSTTDGLAHLAERGARLSACCLGPQDDTCASNRIRTTAYREFARAHPELGILPVELNGDLVETGYAFGESLRTDYPEVDGVFTGSDELAAGILLAAQENDIAVADRLRILGFDDRPIAEVMGISTVRQPVYAMGRKSLRVLHRQINRSGAGLQSVSRIDYELKRRATN